MPINVKSASKEDRERIKSQFFTLYRKNGSVKESAESIGLSLKTAANWIRAYKLSEGTIPIAKKRGPREGMRKLKGIQEKLMAIISRNDPYQLGIDYGLWNAEALKQLIERRFSIKISLTTVKKYIEQELIDVALKTPCAFPSEEISEQDKLHLQTHQDIYCGRVQALACSRLLFVIEKDSSIIKGRRIRFIIWRPHTFHYFLHYDRLSRQSISQKYSRLRRPSASAHSD